VLQVNGTPAAQAISISVLFRAFISFVLIKKDILHVDKKSMELDGLDESKHIRRT